MVIDKLFNSDIVLDKLSKNLYLFALAKKVRNSNKNILNLIQNKVDDVFKNSDNLFLYLKKHVNSRYNFFNHCVIPIYKNEIIKFIYDNEITIEDVFNEIDNVNSLFENLDCYLYQSYPIFDQYNAKNKNMSIFELINNEDTPEINGFFNLFVLILKLKFNNTIVIDNVVYINLKDILEYYNKLPNKLKFYKDNFLDNLYNKLKSRYDVNLIYPKKTIKLNNSITNIHIIKIYGNKKIDGMTFIIERCSKYLLSELINNYYNNSFYTERDLMYTKTNKNDIFVIPKIELDKRSKKYKNVNEIINNTLITCINSYIELINNNEIDKSKAIYVLPEAIENIIMITMFDNDFNKFINDGNNKNINWELSNIINTIKSNI